MLFAAILLLRSNICAANNSVHIAATQQYLALDIGASHLYHVVIFACNMLLRSICSKQIFVITLLHCKGLRPFAVEQLHNSYIILPHCSAAFCSAAKHCHRLQQATCSAALQQSLTSTTAVVLQRSNLLYCCNNGCCAGSCAAIIKGATDPAIDSMQQFLCRELHLVAIKHCAAPQ